MEKICPIMSRPVTFKSGAESPCIDFVDCQREKCQLWVEVVERTPAKSGAAYLEETDNGHCGLINF
jgi:hypothetical protein